MKILLLLLLPMTILGQGKLEGKYCTPGELSGQCLTFHIDGSYYYENWVYFGKTISEGFGHYIIKKDSLILTFAGNDSINRECYIHDKACKNEDSVSNYSIFDCLVLEENNNLPLPRAIITIVDSAYNSINLTLTDSLGKAMIKVNKREGDYWLNIYYNGSNKNLFKIQLNGCKDVKFIYPENSRLKFPIDDGVTWIYKINKRNRKKLVIKKEGYLSTTLYKIKNDK